MIGQSKGGDILDAKLSYNIPTETIIPLSTTPTKFGFGATEELGCELQRLGLKRVVLVSDANIVETGLPAKIEKILDGEGVDIEPYYDVGVEPTDVSFKKAIDFLKGKKIDGLVAVGGGSVIDTAKAMNLYSTYPADLLDYINPPDYYD
jgi:hydroxyacid-oxoacid transhydrogenase